jgi:transcriptional regulator with GAF, ATPase, and Fis domain
MIWGSLQEALDRTLIGESELMQALKKSIQTVANSEETVLITGESGTGKELIARAVHDLSPRRNQPFLAINCGALTESLLESELFGHLKGAFTGANVSKKGIFESASGGSVFLDEFGEMSAATQVKLLRVLQERKVRPVGLTNSREIEIDARVLVATNHDLKQDISQGKFRSDLYYRVNVLEVRAPALRDRSEDVLPLA